MIERKIKLTWEKKELSIIATMDLAHDIESIINVPHFIMGMSNQTASMVDCAKITGAVLRSGGVEVSNDEVYETFCDSPLAEILQIVGEFLYKVFPMFFQEVKKKK